MDLHNTDNGRPSYRYILLCLLLLGLLLLLLGTTLPLSDQGLFFEKTLSNYFSSVPCPELLTPVIFITRLNSPPVMLVLLLTIAGRLLYHGHRRTALFAFASLGGTALLNSLLKLWIARERPADRLLPIDSHAFPSWHSATSAALALTLWLLFVRPLPPGPKKTVWSIVLLLWPLLIGFSRLFLNVHWASDILAGWGLGILMTALFALVFLPKEAA
jgi:undecaprenyl-diphosphatase